MWIIIIAIILFILWNITLVGYRDKHTEALDVDLSKVFCEEAKSIVLKQDSKTAILLVHGFPSTPSVYKYSSEKFFQAGMDVYAPLLPGFGTDPMAFADTTFTQWFSYLCKYYENLRSSYETLYVLGISMGGAMTLKLGETYCNSEKAPDALVSIAAPVTYNSLIRDGIISDYKQYFARTLALFKAQINAHIVQGNPKGDDGSEYWYGYGGIFIRAGLSLVHAMKQIRKDLHKITCPLLSIHDVNDGVVPFKNQAIITAGHKSSRFKDMQTHMEKHKHPRHALLLYRSIQGELTQTIIDFLQDKEDEADAQA